MRSRRRPSACSDGGWGVDTTKKLRQEAAKLGGDAVLITGASESAASSAGYGGGVFTAISVPVKRQTARVIVFTSGGYAPTEVNRAPAARVR